MVKQLQLQFNFSFNRSSMAIKAVGYKTCQHKTHKTGKQVYLFGKWKNTELKSDGQNTEIIVINFIKNIQGILYNTEIQK
jgi:hypothetical protein